MGESSTGPDSEAGQLQTAWATPGGSSSPAGHANHRPTHAAASPLIRRVADMRLDEAVSPGAELVQNVADRTSEQSSEEAEAGRRVPSDRRKSGSAADAAPPSPCSLTGSKSTMDRTANGSRAPHAALKHAVHASSSSSGASNGSPSPRRGGFGGHSPEAAMGSVGSPSSRRGAAGARALLDRRRSLDRDPTDSDSSLQLDDAQVGVSIGDRARRHGSAESHVQTRCLLASWPTAGDTKMTHRIFEDTAVQTVIDRV